MEEKIIREQLLVLLDGGKAHLTFDKAIADLPPDKINARADGIPYSVWDLVEHLRIAQFDILDFIRNPNYKMMKWPDEYWPDKNHKATPDEWHKSVAAFHTDLEAVKALTRDPATNLTAPLLHAPDYNILREVLLVADHNAYHIGQIVTARRALGIY